MLFCRQRNSSFALFDFVFRWLLSFRRSRRSPSFPHRLMMMMIIVVIIMYYHIHFMLFILTLLLFKSFRTRIFSFFHLIVLFVVHRPFICMRASAIVCVCVCAMCLHTSIAYITCDDCCVLCRESDSDRAKISDSEKV